MNATQFNNAFTLFLSLLVEAVPFLMLGVLFSGILQVAQTARCSFGVILHPIKQLLI